MLRPSGDHLGEQPAERPAPQRHRPLGPGRLERLAIARRRLGELGPRALVVEVQRGRLEGVDGPARAEEPPEL